MTPDEWNALSDSERESIRASLSDLGKAACEYCDKGLAVTPLWPESKEAQMSDGFKTNFDYWEDAAFWWMSHPDSNIGIVTGAASGVVVVDIDADRDKGKYGDYSLQDWESDNGPLPETATVSTPSGGEHRYYRLRGGMEGSNNGNLCIDIKADGGYVVAPPSVHPNGGTYIWDLDPDDYGIHDADEQVELFVYHIKASEPATSSGGGGYEFPAIVHDGEGREKHLSTLSFSLRAKGHDFNEILDELRRVNSERVVPPKPDKDLRRMAKSACRKKAGLSEEYQRAKDSAEADMLLQAERQAEMFEAAMEAEREGGEPVDEEVQQKIANATMNVIPQIIRLSSMKGKPLPPLRGEVIEGVLRENCKMLVQGASKAGKTWAMIELSVAMSTGGRWLGFKCRKGRVLYVNFELQHESFMNRLSQVCKGMRTDIDEAMENIDLWNLRGFSASMEEMNRKHFFPLIKRGEYQLIILDPFYKLMEGSENDAEVVGAFVRHLENLAVVKDVAVCYVHHYSKGMKGDVSPMDRSSGSGVFARDADALIDMAGLDTDGDAEFDGMQCMRVSAVLRDFPPIPSFDVMFSDFHHYVDAEGRLADKHVESMATKGAKASAIKRKEDASSKATEFCDDVVDMIANNGWEPVRLSDVIDVKHINNKTAKRYIDLDDRLRTYKDKGENNAVFVYMNK